MIAANQQLLADDGRLSYDVHEGLIENNDHAISLYDAAKAQTLLPSRQLLHTPQSGLNPIVDAAGYLLSVLGNLKIRKNYKQLKKIEKDLRDEVKIFQERLHAQGYQSEYILVCRYILCATFDDIIATLDIPENIERLSFLQAHQQDQEYEKKFFEILDRALHEPMFYIDIMELIYLCLSLGYQGKYRHIENGLISLEQISDTLYKHIRAYRGNISKILSPNPFRITKIASKHSNRASATMGKTFFAASCAVMMIFISLSYLMDILSNDVYRDIAQVEKQLINYYS